MRPKTNFLLLLLCLLTTQFQLFSQPSIKTNNNVAPKILNTYDIYDKLNKEAKPYRLSSINLLPATSRAENSQTNTCRTSVFYMNLPVETGEKIVLQKVQTSPDGNFIVGGTITLSDKSQEGLLLKMTNAGVILSQTRIKINNQSTDLYSVKVMLNGDIIIAGSIKDGSNSVFLAGLHSDLSINWTKLIPLPSSPLKVTLALSGSDQLALGVQFSSSVYYATLNLYGSIKWGYDLPVNDLTDLVGFCNFNYQSFGLVISCIQNGLTVSKIIEINNNDGSIRSSSVAGKGDEENKYMDATYFNQTLDIVGINHSDGSYHLVRTLNQTSNQILTKHTYSLAEDINFNVTAAMDNAGDALGFCLPDKGKLIFIKHFSYYGTVPDFTNEYTVPKGASLTSVTRSLQDGGFLFALNTADNKESILLKTDSIGSLPDCGFTLISNDFHEEINSPNTVATYTSNANYYSTSDALLSATNKSLVPQFSCNETYCPTEPIEDSCLSSYYKILRSNSYIDFFGSYYLMRNNRQIAITGRYDRVLGDGNQTMEGLKLFDEAGHFLKGVNIFLNGISGGVGIRQMDDTTIMLIGYSTSNQVPEFTFTLVSDNLNVLWSKSVKTYSNYEFFPSGTAYDDLVADGDGNYYFVTNSTKFYDSKSKILVYKMDKYGNQVWLKTYEMNKGTFGLASATTTKSSLIIILEGSFDEGSGSVRIDKNTGEMQNSFLFQNKFDGELYNRLVKFSNDRIYYAGSSNGQIVLGTFDTTGRPLKLKYLQASNSVPRAANAKNGMLYIAFDYYDGSSFKDGLVKADSALVPMFINQYNVDGYRLPMGLNIGDNGSIYVGGNTFNQDYGGDAYIEKYDSDGQLGTCSYNSLQLSFIDINPQTTVNSFTTLQREFQPIDIPLTLAPDIYGQAVGSILCSSAPQCSSIKLSGTNSVCRLNEDYPFFGTTNANCTLQPLWLYDTTYTSLHNVTADTAKLQFKKLGTTYVIARINAGCKFYDDSVQVQIQSSPSTFSLGKDTLLCPGDSLILNAGTGFNSYLWQNGSKDSEFIATKAGKYYVKVDNVCKETYQDTILLSSALFPSLNIGIDTTVCKGDTVQLSASSGFAKYNWSSESPATTQSQQITVVPQQNTDISLTATTSDGCVRKDSLTLTVINARPINLGRDTSFCVYDSIILSAGAGYLQYNWNNGNTASNITVKQAGSYWVNAKDVDGCFADDTLVVDTLFVQPMVNLGSDVDLCSGTVKQLDAGNYSSYLWQDGNTSQYYPISQPGKYWVSITDGHGCVGSDTFSVQKLLPLPVNFLKATDSICEYEKKNIYPTGSFTSYQWSTGSLEPTILVNKAGIYTLQVQDASGCKNSDTIRIVQKQCLEGVFIPTAFTPNHDGINDVFRAKVFGIVVSFQLQIFDRFGSLIFTSNNPSKGWDGTNKGISYDAGSFVYQCSYQLSIGKPTFDKGTIVLIR